MFDFFGLDESERFKEFVHRAKPTWEDDKGMRIFDKHRFTHKKVAKIQRDIQEGVGRLLKGEFDIAADGECCRLPVRLCWPLP